jgi:hypothetical protein
LLLDEKKKLNTVLN